jgi:hypothetical protein
MKVLGDKADANADHNYVDILHSDRSCLRLLCPGADGDLQRLLAIIYVDPAEHLTATDAAAFFTPII